MIAVMAIIIELDENLEAQARADAKAAGCANLSDYVTRLLIHRETHPLPDEVTAELRARQDDPLEDSIPADEFWANFHARIARRRDEHASRLAADADAP
jgi:hypothetical protein